MLHVVERSWWRTTCAIVGAREDGERSLRRPQWCNERGQQHDSDGSRGDRNRRRVSGRAKVKHSDICRS